VGGNGRIRTLQLYLLRLWRRSRACTQPLCGAAGGSLCASRGDACMDQRWKHECWFGRGGFSARRSAISAGFLDNRDAKKIASSVVEATLGRQASGSWVWSSSVTAQSSAERSLVHSGGSTCDKHCEYNNAQPDPFHTAGMTATCATLARLSTRTTKAKRSCSRLSSPLPSATF
jgi:hypothetical protein